MNSLIIVLGSVILSGPAWANEQESMIWTPQETLVSGSLQNESWAVVAQANPGESFEGKSKGRENEPEWASVDDITFLEAAIEIELGFDTAEYLPEGFDPHKSFFDLNAIHFMESEAEVDLGFDTRPFLPVNFNPYTDVVGLAGINFMEEETVELGFDTVDYLPEGFSPYRAHWDLRAIPPMDEELEVDLGPYVGYGLPEDFNPYTNVVGVGAISFMEPEDLELGFDTKRYLPKDFDPYSGSKQ